MPIPNDTPSVSLVQRNAQGDAAHLDKDPSKETGELVVGFTGLKLKAGTDGLTPCVTTTSCSTLTRRQYASVTVRRTCFVPTSRNVKDILLPRPSSEPSSSSVHL